MVRCSMRVVAAVAVAGVVHVGTAFGGIHEDDLLVGRSGDGRLVVNFDFAAPVELVPTSGLLTGWAGVEPGFMSLMTDMPLEDIYVLSSGADIGMRVESLTPGLRVWRPGLTDQLEEGEQLMLGESFDRHFTFHIDSTDPAYDPLVEEYTFSFKLHDAGTTDYSKSEEFTVTFVAVPEPTSLALVGLTGLVACRRRRR